MLKMLKPSILKVILAIALSATAYFIFWISFGCAFGGPSTLICTLAKIPAIFLLMPMIVDRFIDNPLLSITLSIILTVTYHYVIASFIVSVFKIRKKEFSTQELLPVAIILLAVCFISVIFASRF
ncbi:MAG: hypothetical protein ACI840_002306 [Ulvibacter sp.]|jgi:hypothetical protein